MTKTNKSFAWSEPKTQEELYRNYKMNEFKRALTNAIDCECACGSICQFVDVSVIIGASLSILEFLHDESKDAFEELYREDMPSYIFRYKGIYYWIFDDDNNGETYNFNPRWVALRTTRKELINCLRNGHGIYINGESTDFDELYNSYNSEQTFGLYELYNSEVFS